MVDLFVSFEIAECFKPADACVSITQIIEMRAELALALALLMIPREGCFECAVHPLDSPICQGCSGLVQRCSVLHAVQITSNRMGRG